MVMVMVMVVRRLIGSLLGKAGPTIKRVKPRVEMSLEASNRRELLKALVHAGAGGAKEEASFASCSPQLCFAKLDESGSLPLCLFAALVR